jgi:hypothetical protein
MSFLGMSQGKPSKKASAPAASRGPRPDARSAAPQVVPWCPYFSFRLLLNLMEVCFGGFFYGSLTSWMLDLMNANKGGVVTTGLRMGLA